MSACNVGDMGSIPGLGRSPGEGNGNPLQYSCLENPMDGGAWRAAVHGVAKSRTRLSDFTVTFLVPQMVKNLPAIAGDSRGKGSIPGSGRSPGEGKWHPTPAFFPGESHRQRSLEGCSPWGRKESDTTE